MDMGVRGCRYIESEGVTVFVIEFVLLPLSLSTWSQTGVHVDIMCMYRVGGLWKLAVVSYSEFVYARCVHLACQGACDSKRL